MTDADVIVIGGGVAGLAAARRITAAGKSVVLIEARGRLGGRIHTVRDAALPLPVELGAEFIHGVPPETWDVVRAARLAVYELEMGDEYQSYRGRLRKVEDIFEVMGKVLKPLRRARKGQSFAAVMGRPKTAEEELAYGYIEGFDAAHPQAVSAKAIHQAEKDAEKIEGERQFRILGGYDGVVEWLRAGCDPARFVAVTGKAVTAVRWKRGRVNVEVATGERYTAKRAVVTLPAGVMKDRAAVRFEPEIEAHRTAAGKIGVGAVVKVILVFREAFWEDIEEFKNLAFIYSRDPAVPTWWTFLPVRTTALTGWSGGPAGEGLTGKSEGEIVSEAVRALARLTGWGERKIRGQLNGWHVADWQSDPFSRGAYSYITAGGEGAVEELAKSVEGTLFFAGEATHVGGQSGTVAGAIGSGYRAAEEALGRGG